MPENTPFAQLIQQQAAPPPAAQPSTTAIPTKSNIQAQPTAAGTAVGASSPATSALAGLPVPENPADISRDIMTRVGPGGSEPLWNAPANRPALQAEMTQRLTHQEQLRQTQEALQTQLAYKRDAVDKVLKNNPNIPDLFKASLEAEAGGLPGIQIGAALTPHPIASGSLGSQLPPGSLEAGTNQPVKPDTRYTTKYLPGTQEMLYYPETAQTGVAQGANGVPLVYNRSLIGAIPGASTPQMNRIINAGVVRGADGAYHNNYVRGGSLFGPDGRTPTDLALGVPPSMVSKTSSQSSVTDPSGQHTATTVTTRGGAPITPLVPTPTTAPGHPATQGATPVPAGPNAPAVTTVLPKQTSVAPFNPTDRVDSLIQQIGNGDTTLAKAATNARDKFQIETRMAQLGLTPANITTSMRERATNARNILKEMDRIDGIINQADKDGDLGVVATRWNSFLTNTLGKDPTKTQVFSKLSSDLGFLSTAVSMAHGGLRGGSSPTMVEHWEHALEAKDPATLRSKLGEARKWMEQYAQLDQGLKTNPANGGINAIPGAATDPAGLRGFVK